MPYWVPVPRYCGYILDETSVDVARPVSKMYRISLTELRARFGASGSPGPSVDFPGPHRQSRSERQTLVGSADLDAERGSCLR